MQALGRKNVVRLWRSLGHATAFKALLQRLHILRYLYEDGRFSLWAGLWAGLYKTKTLLKTVFIAVVAVPVFVVVITGFRRFLFYTIRPLGKVIKQFSSLLRQFWLTLKRILHLPHKFCLFSTSLALCKISLVVAILVLPSLAQAQKKTAAPIIIRDTEIENILKEWTEPLFKAAEINPNNVKIVLVQSPQLNAFVAGGANIFLYTGLIEKTKNPEELIGVLAHELGHIAGGHLISTRNAYKRASYESILGTVIGIGAAILTGRGEAAQAVISGSQNIAGRRFLANSRINESAADQAALRFMEKGKVNPAGLISFFETLGSQELLPFDQQTEYVRTQPITRNRIDAVRRNVQASPFYNQAGPMRQQDQHARMKAKLMGFINPERVPWIYDDRDHSIAANYARTIAAYRTNKIDDSLRLIDELIAQEPDNPYFLELKGQMLLEFGRVAYSIPAYRSSIKLRPPHPGLIRIALAQALLEMSFDEALIREAVENLNLASGEEPRSTRLFRLLATAHGKLGDHVKAQLYLAEEAVLQKRYSYAKKQAEFVIKNSAKGSREQLQAKDLLAHIEQIPAYK